MLLYDIDIYMNNYFAVVSWPLDLQNTHNAISIAIVTLTLIHGTGYIGQ